MALKIIKTVQIKRIELLKPTKNGIKIVHIKNIFISISYFLNFTIKEEFGKIYEIAQGGVDTKFMH